MGRPLNLHKYGNDRSLVTRDQIVVQAFLGGTVRSAYLLQQKKNNAFHVIDTTGVYTGICTFVNSASPVAGQMSCLATLHGGGTFYVSRITNRYVYDFLAAANAAANKYFWGFVDKAPDRPLDYPALGFAVLPSAVRTANTNLAP